jgi:hypothetical protein
MKGMTFNDLIKFVFPFSPPSGKWFITKSSLDSNGKQYLPKQILDDIFLESYV